MRNKVIMQGGSLVIFAVLLCFAAFTQQKSQDNGKHVREIVDEVKDITYQMPVLEGTETAIDSIMPEQDDTEAIIRSGPEEQERLKQPVDKEEETIEIGDPVSELNGEEAPAETQALAGTGFLDNPGNQQYFIESYSGIPETVRTCLLSAGYTVFLTAEAIEQTEFGGQYARVQGCTNPSGRYIKIRDTKRDIDSALYHEIGHALEDIRRPGIYNDAFSNCFYMESAGFREATGENAQNTGSIHEYFAECIRLYFVNPALFMQAAPESFHYVEEFLAGIA